MKNETYLYKGGVVVLRAEVRYIASVNDNVIEEGVADTKIEAKQKCESAISKHVAKNRQK